MAKTVERSVWQAMLRRCTNPKAKDYKYYGGRGITVDMRWGTFEQFLLDMGYRPSAEHQLDRVDNNKGYYPENCRWTTRTENMRNRSNCIKITFNDKTLCLSEWAIELNVHEDALYGRIKMKWPLDKILTTPFRIKNKGRLK